MDRKDREAVTQAMEGYLQEALQHYQTAIAASHTPDLEAVFRIIALWFANHSNDTVNTTMLQFVQHAPSYKFLPLTYQITSRLGFGNPKFRSALLALVSKICVEHPHHSLLQIFALASAKLHPSRSNAMKQQQQQQHTAQPTTQKALAAQQL